MDRPLNREEIAWRAAQDIPDGAVVNLGFGVPLLIAECLPEDREIMLHSENGLLGFGPTPPSGEEDPDVMNAGAVVCTTMPGASYFSHVDSFVMIRGGHIDISMLGAFEVAANGDLANWSTGLDSTEMAPAIGGAMDLACGAKRVHVLAMHNAKDGSPRIVEKCQYPLTAPGCVSRVYTDIAVVDIEPDAVVLREILGGMSFDEIQVRTGAKLIQAPDCTQLSRPDW